ncbi:hypothetical protein [Caballeronia ptereochthonis]|uniref:hypothetical protein n=1 Tax=Caballeronia ptereochthonis TaxID=1777144 RepID=UPI00117D923B|nr:hypothetical protein [Caballeronia ptereochthonis]
MSHDEASRKKNRQTNQVCAACFHLTIKTPKPNPEKNLAASRHVTRSASVFHHARFFAYLTQYVSPPDAYPLEHDSNPHQFPDLTQARKTGMEYAIGLSTQESGYAPDEAQLVTCI